MAKFNFRVFQNLSREAIIEVEASSLEEARDNVNSIDSNDIPWEWSADDITVENQ